MNKLQKAQAWFEMHGIPAEVLSKALYIDVQYITIEVSKDEIAYRAEEYDTQVAEGAITF